MAIDIQGLNDTLLKTSKNYDEVVRKWVDLALAPAKDVPIEYYDQNGNLVQATVPNRAKLFNDLLVNVFSIMYRTYYVDQINGSDTNDGSQATPFKSIKKAIDSAPVGSYVKVILMSNYTAASTDVITIINKTVEFVLNGHTITFPVRVGDGLYNTLNYLKPYGNTTIIFNNGTITIEDSTIDPNLPFDSYAQVIAKTLLSSGSVLLNTITLNLPTTPNIAFMSGGKEHSLEFMALKLYNTVVNASDTGSKLIATSGGVIALFTSTVSLNGATNWSNLLTGIVRDTNGTPRNVISNLIL